MDILSPTKVAAGVDIPDPCPSLDLYPHPVADPHYLQILQVAAAAHPYHRNNCSLHSPEAAGSLPRHHHYGEEAVDNQPDAGLVLVPDPPCSLMVAVGPADKNHLHTHHPSTSSSVASYHPLVFVQDLYFVDAHDYTRMVAVVAAAVLMVHTIYPRDL